jgi:hypothetical protein
VVRGPAAVLAVGAGVAYFLLAPSLPDGGGVYAAGVSGAVAAGLCALAPLGGRDEPGGLTVFAVGAVLLAIALNARDVGAAASPPEALFAAAAGMLFAWAFAVPAAVLAVPLLVAGIDVAAVLAGGADAPAAGPGGDLLTLDLPAWGGDGDVSRLGLLDATFLAMFAAWAFRYDLRPRLACALMVAALAGAVALGLALDRSTPTLAFVSAGMLVAAPARLVRSSVHGDVRRS